MFKTIPQINEQTRHKTLQNILPKFYNGVKVCYHCSNECTVVLISNKCSKQSLKCTTSGDVFVVRREKNSGNSVVIANYSPMGVHAVKRLINWPIIITMSSWGARETKLIGFLHWHAPWGDESSGWKTWHRGKKKKKCKKGLGYWKGNSKCSCTENDCMAVNRKTAFGWFSFCN